MIDDIKKDTIEFWFLKAIEAVIKMLFYHDENQL